MNKPEIIKNETIVELRRGENNPRNSEGDFAILKDGSILFAYSRYHGGSSHDNAPCDIAGMISHDNGKSFKHLDTPLATAAEHGVSNIMSVSFCRIDNGELCLFYLCKKGCSSAYYLKRAIGDETQFGKPELCVDFDDDIYYVINNCRICKLANGRLLAPAAMHKILKKDGRSENTYFGTTKIFGCDADGRNWHAVSDEIKMPYPGHSATGLQEPGVVVLPDGRLYGYFRTDRCFQYESFSSDDGKTWTIPVQSRFTSPDSPMLIFKNPYSGIYYSVWNPIPNYNERNSGEQKWCHAGRNPFVIAQSENGIDFSSYTVLENEPEHGYCYPAVLFLNEHEMLMSYCCGGPEDDNCLTKTKIIKITI